MSVSSSQPPSNQNSSNPIVDKLDTSNPAGFLKAALFGISGCIVITLVILGVMVLFGITSVNSIVNGAASMFQLSLSPTPAATVITSQTIVESIQPLGELVSLNVQLAKADVFVGVQQGTLNTCGFAANHVAQGSISAGIDLTASDPSNVTYDASTNTYTLRLASPRLTGCHVDYIRQYDRSTTACNVDWDEARLIANYVSLTEFRDDALEGGILETARNQAALVIKNFVTGLTGANVIIEFAEESDVPVLPSTCQPEPPNGWSYDNATNSWVKQ